MTDPVLLTDDEIKTVSNWVSLLEGWEKPRISAAQLKRLIQTLKVRTQDLVAALQFHPLPIPPHDPAVVAELAALPLEELLQRLRGIYTIPVNDGAGPLNGSTTFTRQFFTGAIQHEAAKRLEALAANQRAVGHYGQRCLHRYQDGLKYNVKCDRGPGNADLCNIEDCPNRALAKAALETPK